jgi:FkbM family methyltransferase
MPHFVRNLKDLRYRLFYQLLLRRGHSLIELGDRGTGCSWFFCPDNLNERSVVYSGGVGRDLTFEHALVQRFGCAVVLCDPSPTGLETMALPANRIPQFSFHSVALAGCSGKLTLAPPQDSREGSWFASAAGAGALQVPSMDLASLLRQNGHDHIDLLKLDIEGAEYDVIADLLRRRLPVRQVAVEYHHGILPGIRRSQTVRSILKMTAAGYRLLKQDGNNHTFLRPALPSTHRSIS